MLVDKTFFIVLDGYKGLLRAVGTIHDATRALVSSTESRRSALI